MNKATVEEKRSYLFGISQGCPYEIDFEQCPVNALQMMQASADRWEFIEQLKDEELDEYLRQHVMCAVQQKFDTSSGIISQLITSFGL